MARIVYHGSGRVDPAFTRGGGSEGRSGIGGDYGPGIYFASKKADAAFYGPHVGKYEISVERPLRICKGQPGDAEVRRLQRVFRISGEALEVEVEDGSHPVAGMMAMVKWGYKPQSVQRVLEKLGYDSICVSAAELRKSSPEVSGDFWIVFDPASIRKLNPSGATRKKTTTARYPNPIGKRLEFVRKQYANRPEVFERTRKAVAHALKTAPDEIDPATTKSWEKAIPWLAKNINTLLKKRERGADVSHELRVLNRSFEQSVRVITDRPKRKGKRQVELSTLSPKQARKFATRTAKTKLEKEQERAAEAGHKIVKKLGDGYVAVVGTPNRKAPRFPSTRAEQEAWVHENARFQQWVGSSMNNCLGWFGAYASGFPLGKFEVQRKGGKLYAILDSKGKPVVATLTNAKNKVIETNGPGNRPPPESAQPYIQKLEKAMGWIGGKKAAFHPPPDFDRRIASVIEMLLDSSYFTDNLRERRYFVRKANGYARQAGADFSGVWPAFAIYILVESKYSALASLRKTDYPKKKDIESIIVKVARLYRSGGSKSEFKDAATAADAAARAARAAYAAYAAANAAANAARAAARAAAYADARAAAYADAAALLVDYANKLLELMHKAASEAGRNLQQQARRNPARRKKAVKQTARKVTPKYQLLITRCQKQWDHYCARPSKKRLKEVFEHLETMKASTSKKVASERARCLRAANKEAKRIGLKV